MVVHGVSKGGFVVIEPSHRQNIVVSWANLQNHHQLYVIYMCIFNRGSLDDIIQNGNYPSVWASEELAVQDINVSFGSVIDSNLFSLSIYEIKECILC